MVLSRCYNGVVTVLQWCYNGVTMVLQWRYDGVTVALRWRYDIVTGRVTLAWYRLTVVVFAADLRHEEGMGVPCSASSASSSRMRLCTPIYIGVTMVLQKCYDGVPKVLQWCYSYVTVMLQ
jgi:hypothetical protein